VVWLAGGCVVETAISDPTTEVVDPVEPVVRVDRDEDGFTEAEGDCDDLDPERGPASAFSETCDLVDNDCDGIPDNGGICLVRDRFDQQMQVDVLFVVDTREGMQPYARRAAGAAGQFAQHLVGAGLDTRIGVLPMASSDAGRFPGLVDVGGLTHLDGQLHGDPVFAARWLEKAIGDNKPTTSAPRGRDALIDHLDVVAEWDGRSFARLTVPLVVVFLSREDDASAAPLGDFRDYLATAFDRMPTMHSIVRLDDGPCKHDDLGAYGASYEALADLSGGVTVDLCTESYDTFFFVIGQLTADLGLERRYVLDYAVNEARPFGVEILLQSGVSEHLGPDDYDLLNGGRILQLHTPAPAGSEVIIDYHRLP